MGKSDQSWKSCSGVAETFSLLNHDDQAGRPIDNENQALLHFYIHEHEEATKKIILANLVYHDQPVGQLTETMLEPNIEELGEAVESGDWDRIQERNQVILQAFNNCHTSIDYPEIVVTEKGELNPFNQDFSKRD